MKCKTLRCDEAGKRFSWLVLLLFSFCSCFKSSFNMTAIYFIWRLFKFSIVCTSHFIRNSCVSKQFIKSLRYQSRSSHKNINIGKQVILVTLIVACLVSDRLIWALSIELLGISSHNSFKNLHRKMWQKKETKISLTYDMNVCGC